MRYLLPCICIIFSACGGKGRSGSKAVAADTLPNGLRIVNTIDSPFNYKDQVTTDSLKGGYLLVYAEDDSLRYVYLQKGTRLSLLDKTSGGTFYSLGQVGLDEDGYFLLAHDEGNSAPYTYEYIDKISMKNVLGYGMRMHDWVKLKEQTYFLYDDTLPGSRRIVLQNMATGKLEYYNGPEKAYEIMIDTLTPRQLRIGYTFNMSGDSVLYQTYTRR